MDVLFWLADQRPDGATDPYVNPYTGKEVETFHYRDSHNGGIYLIKHSSSFL